MAPLTAGGLVKCQSASVYGADSHLLKKGVVCDLWVGLWIGLVVVISAPADDRAICSDGTSVIFSGRDQIGWRDVIERRSLALRTGGCAGKPDRKHHKKWQTASQHAADMKGEKHITQTSELWRILFAA